MGSIIKTISLDVRTAKIAETIPNFSQWIRAKLLELEEVTLLPQTGWEYTCPICRTYWVYAKQRFDRVFCKEKTCENYMFTPINEYEEEVDL